MAGRQSATRTRWHTAAALLAVASTNPGITRIDAAHQLGLSTGAATDLLARLRASQLIDEGPAPVRGRGRPTTALQPHPDGPLVITVELSAVQWRVALSDLFGQLRIIDQGSAPRATEPAPLLNEVATAITAAYSHHPTRICVVSVSVAGTVSDDHIVQFTPRGWNTIDLRAITNALPAAAHIPVLLGNDAALAGLTEARTGASRSAHTALHLHLSVGIGGSIIVNGTPASGAHGAAGEYGHIPFGDPLLRCPCGANGCWDLTVDGRALAGWCGQPPPIDSVAYMRKLIAEHTAGGCADSRIQQGFDAVAASLARGTAALVNIHDPDTVTLGGLAGPLRAMAPAAFQLAYHRGLMAFRKHSPPPVVDATYSDDGPLRGAALAGIDHAASPQSLARWSSNLGVRS